LLVVALPPGITLAQGKASPARTLPQVISPGDTFEVKVTFTAPADVFNSIGIRDTAPEGWNVAVNALWCDPVPEGGAQVVEGNSAQFIWYGPFDRGTKFEAVYKVTTPQDASVGSPVFIGTMEYYIGNNNYVEVIGEGGGTVYYISVDMLGNILKYQINRDGNLEQAAEVSSRDGKVTISLGKGTACLGKDGKRLENIGVCETYLPLLPESHYPVGKAYNLEPSGATFAPAFNLTIGYEDNDIPRYVAEEGIYISYYNATAGSWVPLTSQVDTQNNTVTARVTHFTTFAIMGTAPSWLSLYWWTIVAGIVIAGLLVYFVVFRRKRARPTTTK